MNTIEMRGITKRFGSLTALDHVDFTLQKGEIHALLGENGAGKTTIMNVLYGLLQPDEGEILVNGRPVRFRDSLDAIKENIGMVSQHFMLIPVLSVTENVVAGSEPRRGLFFDFAKAAQQVEKLARDNGFSLDVRARAGDLSVGELQRVEILKVLYKNAQVLIFDEPTAVLTPQEVDELFLTFRRLRDEGKSIVLITHKLGEVMQIADRVTVLRDGHLIGSVEKKDTSIRELVKMMVGREVSLGARHRSDLSGKVKCSIRDLSYTRGGLPVLSDINIDIREGEIYGIAGIEGNGQTELLEVLTGLLKPDSMTLTLDGRQVTGAAVDFIRSGIGHVPEDRLQRGLVRNMTVAENIILGYEDKEDFSRSGLLRQAAIQAAGTRLVDDYNIKTPDCNTPVSSLSGGNQQKVIIARVFSEEPDFVVCAQPTRGIDIAASEYIHEVMFRYRDQGKAILLVSADLDEIKTMSDRIGVLYKGRIVDEDLADNFDDDRLGCRMAGVDYVPESEGDDDGKI
ncbi:ABC transporter ATP-binding protein [Anaerofilum sp. BX8]|uniref:ABC transporter ATP-binding protein n=1 Tax=Anaerofilum hominis TaxID=2763016 RepID=A0A923I555_9FIRM|nr:ABC transporter ATP-binding protein [Anaerofilum hominis]